jgi:dTDP-4-amino-4,6-dideoxygalactose transaminase
MNSHLEKPYEAEGARASLPRSEEAQQHGVILPLVPSMTMDQVQEICDSLAAALR